MRYALRKAKEGFTLVELMIVVAIIGVLAVLAIYGVRKYIANSKTAEARNAIGQMAKDAATYYEKESGSTATQGEGTTTAILRSLCAGATASVPAAGAKVQGVKYQSSVAEWNKDEATAQTGFACLSFTMDQPQYYMYSYASTGTAGAAGDTFTCLAYGDLNGDTTMSTFGLIGAINAHFAVNTAPNVGETQPEE